MSSALTAYLYTSPTINLTLYAMILFINYKEIQICYHLAIGYKVDNFIYISKMFLIVSANCYNDDLLLQ